MIISVRGTSGSGKTYLAREIIRKFSQRQEIRLEGKVRGYWLGESLRIMGPYTDTTWSGGADMMGVPYKDRDTKFELLSEWAAVGDVLYEGLMEANEVQRTVLLNRTYHTHVIFLTTSLNVCLAAINARRALKGNLEPVSLKKTTEKFKELKRVEFRLRDAGVQTYWLDRDAALAKVRELLDI